MPTVEEEALKESNIARSFYKFFSELDLGVKILYGDEADEFPDNPENVLARNENTVIMVQFSRFAGGRGDDPHQVQIDIWTRKASDPYGAIAEQWRDSVRLGLNNKIPMYSFGENRLTPEPLGNNYNLYPRYEGSFRLSEVADQIGKWQMLFNVYSWRGSSRY